MASGGDGVEYEEGNAEQDRQEPEGRMEGKDLAGHDDEGKY